MLFVGDDWAEDHHDVEVMDASGRVLARARLPEAAAGMARLHAMIGEASAAGGDVQVTVGIETDRGLRVQALAAAGYLVFGINPLQTSRYRERHGVSGAKSDTGDAHALADMVRTDAHQLRPVAGDSPAAQAVKVVARAHKTLIWERTRQVQRLRHQLLDFLPRRAGSLRRPGRPRHPGAAGPGPRPRLGGEADHRADRRGAQARPPPGPARQVRRDQDGAAQPATDPATPGHRRVRCGGPVADRCHHHSQRAD